MRFESLENRQMFDGSSVSPVETEQTATLNHQEASPVWLSFDARSLLPYIEQDNVESIRAFPWLTHLDRQVEGETKDAHYNQPEHLDGHRPFAQATLADVFWIDFDLPIKTTPDGRSFKPLFVFHVEDLDNRVNVNVDGNTIQGASPIQPGGAGETLPHFWVVGTELPAVVVNEALVEHESSPNGDSQPGVWVMLSSPLQVNSGSVPPGWEPIDVGADELHSASLRNAYMNPQFVRSWNTSGDADDRPTEEIAFYYTRIAFGNTYR